MPLYAEIIINKKSPALDRVFTYSVPLALSPAVQPGMLVEVPFNRERLEGVVIRFTETPPAFETRDILAILQEKPLFTPELLQLSAWLGEYYCCSRAAALQAMLPAGLVLTGRPPKLFYEDVFFAPDTPPTLLTPKRRALLELLLAQGPQNAAALGEAGYSRDFLRAAVKAGTVLTQRRRVTEPGEEEEPPIAAQLSPEQQAVYESIHREWQQQDRPFLLHGVTGSGKTEIYLRLIRDMAANGRQSILLTPEIALSTQMAEMLNRRLELPAAVLHSGLKPAERRQIWQDISAGRITVVVGARSAIFAPLPALGLIIIDEEHESSYKQDQTPRFAAVTTANKRAELAQAHLLLGSATPSVESYHAALSGAYALGRLTSHYHPAPPPRVEVVDMRQELRSGHRLIFSRALLAGIEETLARGGQGILFLNRRGYYQHFSCRNCGGAIACPHCAVAMSYHEERDGGWLKCHYCGREQRVPELCPTCGSPHIRHFGVGTQRVEDELRQHFPTARIARLDSDVMEQRGLHEQILRQMRQGDLDLLVGTQMVAKGLDFPRVELAAVIAADTLLNLPDWRAAERTFQLITQLIGRAGRRDRQGLALIQTYTPEALPIAAAATGDYQLFYKQEVRERQLHGYPPYNHLLRLLLTSPDRGAALVASEHLASALRPLLAATDELCGPADAPLNKIKDQWRRQLIIKTDDVERCGQLAETLWQPLHAKDRDAKETRLTIDVDPAAMM